MRQLFRFTVCVCNKTTAPLSTIDGTTRTAYLLFCSAVSVSYKDMIDEYFV